MPELLLALDVGTTSVRALLASPGGDVLGVERSTLATHFPRPGLVEQDAAEIWRGAQKVIAGVLAAAGRRTQDVAAMGVTTQRAGIVVWERATGEPAAPMIVWSDLRGLGRAAALSQAGFLSWPQTPACKLEAALVSIPEGRIRAARGELAWGTLDSYLVFRLSAGGAHITDLSNAWASGYLDYMRGAVWNQKLLEHQELPAALFPRIVDTWGALATATKAAIGAEIPICAIVADQQAGLFAHAGLAGGAWKATYGTSAVVIASTGVAPLSAGATMPMQALAAARGRTLYCVEGMVITSGAFLDWFCDLGLFGSVPELEAAARAAAGAGEVAIRPSWQGLGAPHGRLDARGVIAGLTPAVGRGELARAALEGLAFRVREIVEQIGDTPGLDLGAAMAVDGGGSAGDFFMQVQADLLARPVRRHEVREGTAYGAAIAAGLGASVISEGDLSRFARYERTFEPTCAPPEAAALYAQWRSRLDTI